MNPTKKTPAPRRKRTSSRPMDDSTSSLMEMYLQVRITSESGRVYNPHTEKFIGIDHLITASVTALGRPVQTRYIDTTMLGGFGDEMPPMEARNRLVQHTWRQFSRDLIEEGYVVTTELELLEGGGPDCWPTVKHPNHEWRSVPKGESSKVEAYTWAAVIVTNSNKRPTENGRFVV